MNAIIFFYSLLMSISAPAAPRFIQENPLFSNPHNHYAINGEALCATAQKTLAYLNKGTRYDPQVIHDGKVFKVPLSKVKDTLIFICQHQKELNNPSFIKKNFTFIRWYPDMQQTQSLKQSKPLIAHLPSDKILMTKYYVHRAQASTKQTTTYPFALHALPKDEEFLTLSEADTKKNLLRFQYGKQAILKGALTNKKVPVLAYLNRDDLEAALMQGTLIADFGIPNQQNKIFNVHRSNNIPFDKTKNPYQQERYWYFKLVDGIKGYGKDADDKITVRSKATFAADLEQFGLGKLLMVQYKDQERNVVMRAGILADTGGAFKKNLYQIDFLSGSYSGKEVFKQKTRHLPDYVNAYFMIKK